MKGYEYVVADVFADAPLEGNQLGVFTDARGIDDALMQRVANEMNYSETTFLFPPESLDSDLKIRIFTPQIELPFAGHPLVGTGFVAAAKRLVPCDPGVLRFATGVGVIEVRPSVVDNRSGSAVMQQPLPKLVREIADDATVADIASSAGLPTNRIPIARSPIAILDNGLPMMVVPLDGMPTIRELNPSVAGLRALADRIGFKTLLFFTTETVHKRSAAHCRVFAPGAGVHEDPATGSANGPFGFYLSHYEFTDKLELESEQGYEMGRPSALHTTLARGADGAINSVQVGGQVFITAEGTMYL